MRVYVETSVWSCVFADDVPQYTADTNAFFARCEAGELEPVISDVVLLELRNAGDSLRPQLLELVRSIGPHVLPLTDAARRLGDVFVAQGAVPPSKPEDGLHVAVAIDAEIDVLVSWNFKHIVNVRRADRFNAIALMSGHYKPLRIVSPSEVMYDGPAEAD